MTACLKLETLNTERAHKRENPPRVKYIEVWKHGELTSGKQDSKYKLEALVSVGNHRKSIINYCTSLFISIR